MAINWSKREDTDCPSQCLHQKYISLSTNFSTSLDSRCMFWMRDMHS